MASLHTLAFEIGTEEIPAFDLHKATAQLEKLVPEALDAVRIPHGAVSVHTTPRRLIVLAEDVAFAIDGAQYAVDAAQHSYTGENASNDMSLVVRVEYGQTSFLFAADAENDRLFELLEEGDLASDVLKVPHHGGYEALSSAFFQAVSPEYAVITSDAENPEDETVVHILSSLGATVYLTRLGSVTMVSDGENLDVSQAAFSEQ